MILANPKVELATSVSKGLLDVLSQLARANSNPIAVLTAFGSAVDVLGNALQRHRLVEAYIAEHNLEHADETVAKLLFTSGLVDQTALKTLVVDSLAQERLIGWTVDGAVIGFLQGSRGGDLEIDGWQVMQTAGSDGLRNLAQRLFWSEGAGFVELSCMGRSFRRSAVVLPLPVPELRDEGPVGRDLVGFADETQRLIGSGAGRSVVLHGPPGTGKSTFVFSYAQLTGKRLLKIGEGVLDGLMYGEIKSVVDALRPDVLLVDDIGKASSVNTMHALLPILRAQYPRMVVFLTCNELGVLGSSFLRPGRAGELIHFGPPTAEEKEAVLRYYLARGPVAVSDDELREAAGLLTPEMTHDWCRSIAADLAKGDGGTLVEVVRACVARFVEVERADEAARQELSQP
jgi:hypothetical protein